MSNRNNQRVFNRLQETGGCILILFFLIICSTIIQERLEQI